MPYADTDFFIALMLGDDRLHRGAIDIYNNFRGRIWTSFATILELLIVTKRLGISETQLIDYVFNIVDIVGIEKSTVLAAAYYIEKEGVSTYDSFHAILCGGEIISSDHVYDRLGIKRIKII